MIRLFIPLFLVMAVAAWILFGRTKAIRKESLKTAWRFLVVLLIGVVVVGALSMIFLPFN